ncbi:polysaccharide deacetylase family protein [Biformimicrobium ophioploci]|nr:polysaccharide deacetylase family protein [Microbulbifer sp. NKW57]
MNDQSARWPNGAGLALSIVVNVEEGSESTLLDGDSAPESVDELGVAPRKPMRAHANESNYEYGIREGWPRVRGLLERYDVPTTFCAAALALERAPQIAAFIRDGKHEACSHGYRWLHQFRMDEEEERAFIRAASASIQDTTGQRPRGWLSRYLHTENTRRLLQEEGFDYHMDDYSADAPFWAPVAGSDRPMLVLPYAIDSNDMKFWTAPSLTPDAWLDYACSTLDVLREEGQDRLRMMSLGLHLRIIGRPGRIRALEKFLAYARTQQGVWFATRAQIADAFKAQVPASQVRAPLRGWEAL